MKSKLLVLLFFFSLFLSCSQQGHYSVFDTFGEDNRWNQTDTKTFDFEITDESKPYDITFKFSHVYDYQFASVPLTFVIESPNGQKETLPVDLKIKDASGKQLADCSGDVCDLVYPIKKKTKLTKGIYKITVSHRFKGAPFLPNVIGIGLNVDSVQ
ncbi:hypothetical protein [Flavobacterium sp. XGLA_31]|uniref:hypothetical protein n=1 Tax=Flavobacterium sp. XGLA_31 TaxID=3447666 RepID=UPI003F3C8695